MAEILTYLPALGVAVIMNIACGTWYNVAISDIKFNKTKFLSGIFKAIIVGSSFIGSAYVFNVVPSLSETIGIEPKALLIAGIGVYMVKAMNNLRKILGVTETIEE